MLDELRAFTASMQQSEEHLRALSRSEHHLWAAADRASAIERQLAHITAIEARREMVAIMADPRLADPLRLERYGFKVHSQHDEDGIIAEIFRRVGEESRTFVEFGAGDGHENCTGFLLLQGWRGLWIDGDAQNVANIRRMWAHEIDSDRLKVMCEFITADTIDGLIRSSGIEGEIDLLVVDLDANDYHVLEKIEAVSPRVICAEYNANFPPEVAWTMRRDDTYVWDRVDYRVGASLKALELLLARRGYTLVGCSVAGVNAFFVRRDLVQGNFAEPFTAENHYHNWRSFYGSSAASDTLWRGWRV
ncbi:MAG TPA: hypothetical protein VKZ79_12920 [Alphaproteobacteria bacterium]|nr:hypothetical protein [Alphaproteobacteria bacterium]